MTQINSPDSVVGMLSRAAHDLSLLQGDWKIAALAGDGSDRRFFRVRQGERHFVALLAPRKAPSGLDENDSYWLIGRHLLSDVAAAATMGIR